MPVAIIVIIDVIVIIIIIVTIIIVIVFVIIITVIIVVKLLLSTFAQNYFQQLGNDRTLQIEVRPDGRTSSLWVRPDAGPDRKFRPDLSPDCDRTYYRT